MAGFTISQGREDGIDFTIPFYEEPSAILLPPPKAESKLFAVVRPFSWGVSITMTVQLFILISVVDVRMMSSELYSYSLSASILRSR